MGPFDCDQLNGAAILNQPRGRMFVPQTFGVPPPPQVSGGVHAPQVTSPPQPSEIEPQVCDAPQ
jgi:hypothetical protein